MITFSAFADEIGSDLDLQMDVCEAHGVRCIDVRNIDGKNCSKMTVAEASEYRRRMRDRGFEMPCLGSPIGKITMDDDFAEHLELLKHCFDVARAFGTGNIRIFSFYPSRGKRIADQRAGVVDRMSQMVAAAEAAGAVLLHENEKRIYGAKPEGVKDLFATIKSEAFKGIFDPANFVEEGVAPFDEGWSAGLAELTDWFHIKDKRPADEACCPAGQGAGQFPQILADLAGRGWGGYMTLEPHMAKAEQFKGFSGPELFAEAVSAIKAACDQAGLAYA